MSRKSCALISKTNGHLAQRGALASRSVEIKKKSSGGIRSQVANGRRAGVLFVRQTVTTTRDGGPTLPAIVVSFSRELETRVPLRLVSPYSNVINVPRVLSEEKRELSAGSSQYYQIYRFFP